MAIITFLKHQELCDTNCTYKINSTLTRVDDLFLEEKHLLKKPYVFNKNKIEAIKLIVLKFIIKF